MESVFFCFILFYCFAVHFPHTVSSHADWDEVVVVKENTSATLACAGARLRGDISINWKVKSMDADEWKLILSASEKKKFSGGASKASMRLTDDNFRNTGNFSLVVRPEVEDGGLYSCLIKKQERKVKERIFLLAVLTVGFFPNAPVPQYSTLRLFARVSPEISVSKITWTAPGGLPMKTEKWPSSGTVTKLPEVQNIDGGTYTCKVYPRGSSTSVLAADVHVTVNASSVASFTNISYNKEISAATQAEKSVLLKCPQVKGDSVLLYWCSPDTKKHSMKLVYKYDRWRDSTSKQSRKLQLAGPPFDPKSGNFSFILTPDWKDGGLYTCEVFLNEVVFSQRTRLSVLKEGVTTSSPHPSLSALLLLVPLAAAAVGVLLWRQKHISDGGIEQSLSVQSGEAGNIYENPEDIRQQAHPQGSVYMDLKPRGDNDIYKELERYEQCQG
ncbi:g6f-like isoform X5 [Fundulus heteroclitus]|uniref:g6f-like isoform X5 n=1 Tax=Fundulus heteroclitus TaxID=8078 RepID=UPI00165BB6EF|nr:g6f-like isoform X5 [Fundulus heteroclitus]